MAEIGLEGGGLSIYNRQDEGFWSFWTGGSSWGLDENDDEVIRSWTSDSVADLALVLPREWSLYHASTIRTDFIGWFRDHYEEARSNLPPALKEMRAEHQHHQCGRVLGL